MRDPRQAKLTSVDFLMVLLTRLDIVPEEMAMRAFYRAKSKIFNAWILDVV